MEITKVIKEEKMNIEKLVELAKQKECVKASLRITLREE